MTLPEAEISATSGWIRSFIFVRGAKSANLPCSSDGIPNSNNKI